ncbi:MAG: hypothetical protein F6J86_43945 [Symploca sp. SIO1B1]|nr:hypothetical protein [Symploca sp. SIO1B1]
MVSQSTHGRRNRDSIALSDAGQEVARHARSSLRLTQEALAYRSSVSVPTVKRFLAGERLADILHLEEAKWSICPKSLIPKTVESMS